MASKSHSQVLSKDCVPVCIAAGEWTLILRLKSSIRFVFYIVLFTEPTWVEKRSAMLLYVAILYMEY